MSKNNEVLAVAADIEDDAYIVARYGENLEYIIAQLGKDVKALLVTNFVNRNKPNEIKTPMVTLRALTQEGQHILSNLDEAEEVKHFNYGLDLDLRRAVSKSKRERLLSSDDVLEKSVKHIVDKLGESREDAIRMVEASPAYQAALAREQPADEDDAETTDDDEDDEDAEEEETEA